MGGDAEVGLMEGVGREVGAIRIEFRLPPSPCTLSRPWTSIVFGETTRDFYRFLTN